MAFLFQVSAPGSNQPNSSKAQTIKPYRFLTILRSVFDVTRYTGKTGNYTSSLYPTRFYRGIWK